MELIRHAEDIDTVVPGVIDAYKALRSTNQMGLYTSAGQFYNHTLFGRDSSNTTAMIAQYDHQITRDAIVALAALQGTKHNRRTQEQPGRIHHELRDFESWSSTFLERLALRLTSYSWGGNSHAFLTYFAADSTSSFIRLVATYADDIDEAILERSFKNKDGQLHTVKAAVASAAEWIISQMDDNDLVVQVRTNRWSLPYQTYQDSVTAYTFSDGSAVNASRPIAYIEVQTLSIDALRDAARLLDDDERATAWRHAADRLVKATLSCFWMEDRQYFSSALQMQHGVYRHVDSLNISAGWILRSSLFHTLGDAERARYIVPTITTLFSDEFLTDVGLRTRSLSQKQPLGATVDYHGNYTVWPMFNYMVIEGLYKHHFTELARELEYRMINGVNASQDFSEFSIVLPDGSIAQRDEASNNRLSIQMRPEAHIAFTIVPAIATAHRLSLEMARPTMRGWQKEAQAVIVDTIKPALLMKPDEAQSNLKMKYLRFDRKSGLMHTLMYYLGQKVRLRS